MEPSKFATDIERLRSLGWACQWHDAPCALPKEILARYKWMPSDYLEFIESLEICANSDETRWIFAPLDFDLREHHAFSHEEWERLSLVSADGDETLISSIKQFWNDHIPICLDVSDGYAFYALRVANSSGSVVAGREPEFEDVTVVAESFTSFLSALN